MKRLEFLKEKFNVVTNEDFSKLLEEDPNMTNVSQAFEAGSISLWAYKNKERDCYILPELTFNKLVDTDPTKNKIYTQWLLNISMSLLSKSEKGVEKLFDRFISEDLPKTKDSLILYDANKRKKKFKEMASKSYSTKHLDDPTNINQYDSLDLLYAVVFPFKPVMDMSDLEKKLEYMVSIGEGEIPVKDEKYTIFIPKTLRASELFSFTSWCTAREGNTMFNHYTSKKEPNGDNSKLYVVIDNKFFKGESDDIYQIHFPSSQIMDATDKRYQGMGTEVLPQSISAYNFFFEELTRLIKGEYKEFISKGNKSSKYASSNNTYFKHAIAFNYGTIIFDIYEDDIRAISQENISIKDIPSLSRFKELRTLYLDNTQTEVLGEDFKSLTNLEMISIPRNKIKAIPESISSCKKLRFINLTANPIDDVPSSIKYLDPTNGGSLFKLNMPKHFENREYLSQLLPSVSISYN